MTRRQLLTRTALVITLFYLGCLIGDLATNTHLLSVFEA